MFSITESTKTRSKQTKSLAVRNLNFFFQIYASDLNNFLYFISSACMYLMEAKRLNEFSVEFFIECKEAAVIKIIDFLALWSEADAEDFHFC